MADQKLQVIWKKLAGDVETAILFLKFSIGIKASIREIKLSPDEDVIDSLNELSITAKKKKSNIYGMSDKYKYLNFSTFVIYSHHYKSPQCLLFTIDTNIGDNNKSTVDFKDMDIEESLEHQQAEAEAEAE